MCTPAPTAQTKWNLSRATEPHLTAAILAHTLELGCTVRDGWDLQWKCVRPFVFCGQYVFTLDIYDGRLVLGVAQTPVERDNQICLIWELADPASLGKLERVLRFARTNTTTPLYML